MNKDAHCYVCVDVLSDCTLYWIPYYTRHVNKDSHRYVGGGLSDWSFIWIPYYTHHMNMDTPQYVCADVL